MRKVLFNLYLDPDEFDFIAMKSAKTGKPRAAIVRDLVKQYRKEEQKKERKEE